MRKKGTGLFRFLVFSVMLILLGAIKPERTLAEGGEYQLELNGSWTSGEIKKNRDQDRYYFSLKQNGFLSLYVQSWSIRDLRFQVWQEGITKAVFSGKVGKSQKYNPKTVHENLALAAGDYYVSIKGDYSRGTYALWASFQAYGEYEALDCGSPEKALPLELHETVGSFLTTNAYCSFFLIRVPSRRKVTFTVKSVGKGTSLSLWTDHFIRISRSEVRNGTMQKPGILKYMRILDPGEYYIKVNSSSPSGCIYDLTVTG